MEWIKAVVPWGLIGALIGVLMSQLLAALGWMVNPTASVGAAGGFGLAVGLLRFVSKKKADAAAEARALVPDATMFDDMARSFGLTSIGPMQLRGNGCLALDSAQLVFVWWVPRRVQRIPLDRLVRVETVRSHLGKSVMAPLLKAHFIDDAGKEESIGLQVREHEAWLSRLQAVSREK